MLSAGVIMRRQTLDAAALVFVFQIYSSVVPSENLSIAELRERNHCLPTNSSKMSDSYLWRVVRDPPVYFFGTVHVPYPRVWDFIPENVKQAFRESENAFFELDLTDGRTMQNLKQCQMLPRGENLSSVLPVGMYRRLKAHLGYVRRMMPAWGVYDERIAANWERRKPIWVMILVNSLNEADIKSRAFPVLDVYLTLEAKSMNKSVGAVEEVEEQCEPLNGLNSSQVLFLLNRTLWQQEALREGTVENSMTTDDDLIWHYNCGDLNSMIFSLDTAQIPNILNSTMTPAELLIAEEIDRYFVQELINKRNQHMAARVKEIIEENRKKSFFFALGAGHFLGNNSVLDLLKAEGFKIENIPADVDLDSLTSDSDESTDDDSSRPNKPRWKPPGDQLEPDDQKNFNELWVPLNTLESNDKLEEAMEEHIATTEAYNIACVSESSTVLLLLTAVFSAALSVT